ncbi:MAG: DUF3817 domain-containing protein [Actinomycetes bacterium]
MSRALKTYRVLAFTTGVLLIVLVFVAVPLNHFAHQPLLATVIGIAHGYLYMAYVVTTLWLSLKQRWPIGKTILVALAGTVPLAAFFAERRVVADALVRERELAALDGAAAT